MAWHQQEREYQHQCGGYSIFFILQTYPISIPVCSLSTRNTNIYHIVEPQEQNQQQ